MYVPFISTKYRRLGGGGGGGGIVEGGSSGSIGSSGGTKGGSSRSPSSGEDTSSGSGKTSGITVAGFSKTVSTYGSGGGKSSVIPSGQIFAGRNSGGGTRSQVYGTQTYGSGYPGTNGRGVDGRRFPFYFWPLAWGGVASNVGGEAYLHSTEYGLPDNTSRPGGALHVAPFKSSSDNTTFHLVADQTTVDDLIASITSNCSLLIDTSANIPSSPINSTNPASPQPEQVIQYYRASSVALTLSGYNNTAVFQAEGTPGVPLPSTVNMTLVNCLNQTIGAAVPLVNAASASYTIIISSYPWTTTISSYSWSTTITSSTSSYSYGTGYNEVHRLTPGIVIVVIIAVLVILGSLGRDERSPTPPSPTITPASES